MVRGPGYIRAGIQVRAACEPSFVVLAVLALLLEGFTLQLEPLDVIGGHLEIEMHAIILHILMIGGLAQRGSCHKTTLECSVFLS